MKQILWQSLKNGSDIRGVATKTPEGAVTLTDKVTKNVAAAFVLWLSNKCNKPPYELNIAVGRDSRVSGKKLSDIFIEEFKSAGAHVIDTGLSTTPSMFMICIDNELNADGSVMLTASHLPFNRNGFKFFTKEGGLEGSDISDILSLAEYGASTVSLKRGRSKKINYLSTYSTIIKNQIINATGEDKPFSGMKIVVDAGNGAGGFYATKVLKPLGADITGSQFLEPDGMFPNHIPNPENKEAMESISKATVAAGAHLGIIFDTDVDRAAIVDRQGKEINKDRLIALISAVLLNEKKGATIVTDSVTSDGLKEFIEKRGGKQHRFKRGYKNVINEAIRLNSEGIFTPLAIETSGHAALMENYFLDDGAYLVTKLLIEAVRLKKQGKELSDLISDLAELEFTKSLRFKIEGDNFKEYGQNILKQFEIFIGNCNELSLVPGGYEGIRARFGKNGWLLLRLSLHDPILPFDIEAESKDQMKDICKLVYDFLKQYENLSFINELLSY